MVIGVENVRSVKVDRALLKLAQLEAVKEDVTLKEWVERAIRAQLDTKKNKLAK